MSTNLIRQYITNKLKETGYQAYYIKATSKAKFPYIEWSMDKNKIDSIRSLYDVEVNIWDDSTDKPKVEDLADKIEQALDDEIHLDDNGLLVFDETTRGYIDDPNKELTRLMLKFDMRFFN